MSHLHKKSKLQSTKGLFQMLSVNSDVGYGFRIMSWMLLDHKMTRLYWRW